LARRNRLSTFALPFLAGSVGIAAAAEIGRRIYRNAQLFCPSSEPLKSWNPADYGIPFGAAEPQWFETPDGELLHGWYCRAEKPIASGIYCHGNTGNLTYSAEAIPHLLNAGFNVLFFDYRGFGKSSGRATVRGVIADGVTAARHHENLRPKGLPSILYGFSLGGAVAGQIIRHHPFDGVILQSTFTSLPEITRVLFPRLPLHAFVGDLYDTLSVVRRLTVPLLVIHGGSDEVVPCWMGHTLHDACKSPKRLVVVDGGLHKDLYVRDCDSLVWAINRFASDLPRDTRHIPLEPAAAADSLVDSAFRYVRRMLRRHLMPQAL
jgi:fermentation-respiration switch protein FrsA (DUF1100 family)